MAMDPINRKVTPPNVPQTTPTGPAKESAPADKKFDVGAVQGQLPAVQAQGAATAIRPNYERMASRIQTGVSRSMSRDQILDDLVDSETKQAFGDSASPQMTAAVADAFRTDPNLSQMFNQLYIKATSRANPGNAG